MKRIYALLLCAALILTLCLPVRAVDMPGEAETAAAYLVENGILLGDSSGDLKLTSGLTRAELAAILTRLNGGAEDVAARSDYFAGMCYFIDVPDWAKPYVGYCADSYLMNGYDLFHFGATDAVSPAMACTVTLRYLSIPETDWNYSTALTKLAALGLTPGQGMDGGSITRGNMAIILYRGLTHATGATQTPPTPPASAPAGSSKGNPKVLTGGDWSREDFSQQASPSIFDSVYTRAAYNAARQAIVDRDTILAGNNEKSYNPSYTYAYTTASAETRSAMEQILARIGSYPDYQTGIEPYLEGYYNYPDYFIIKAERPSVYDAAIANLASTVAELRAMGSDADRIRRINDIICDKMSYDEKSSAMPNTVFTASGVSKGKCSDYTFAFLFLCNLTDIPCVYLVSQNHGWNAVYVNGTWSYVDVVINDIGDELEFRDSALFTASFPDPGHVDSYPQITAFAKELLVPGSTK